MIFPAFAALAAGLVAASPVQKRQQSSSGSLTLAPAATVTVAVPTVIVSPINTLTILTPSAVVATSASGSSVMSGMSSMASGVSSMMPNSTGMSNSTAGNPLYPCPTGYNLGYVETQMNYNQSLADVVSYAGDFQNATWMYYLNGTGGNTVGATRYLATMNGSKTEVLSQYFTDMENVAVQLVMNLTSGPIMTPNGARLSNYSTVLQVYTNTTASMNGRNITTAKLFCNFCAMDASTGMMAVRSSLNNNLETLQTELMGGMVTYPGPNVNPAGNMTMSTSTASMMSGASTMSGSSMSSMMSSSGISFASGLTASTTAIPLSGSSVSVVVPIATGTGQSVTATETVAVTTTRA